MWRGDGTNGGAARAGTAGRYAAAAAMALALSACGSGTSVGVGAGVGTGGVGVGVGIVGGGLYYETGVARVALADAPACGIRALNLTITGVRLHPSASAEPADGGYTDIPLQPPRRVDLLSLVNGAQLPLGDARVPWGRYDQARLTLAPTAAGTSVHSVGLPGGGEVPLEVPAGATEGLKATGRFFVPPGGVADVVLDVDACRSLVRRADGSYVLRPVIRTIGVADSGAIRGVVDPSVLASGIGVSAQRGATVLRATTPDASGTFALAPVPADGAQVDLVISGNGRTTVVLAGVALTVGSRLQASADGAPILVPPSPVRTVSGTVSGRAAAGNAAVRATTITRLGVVEAATVNVDPLTGGYTLALPTAAPLIGSWNALGRAQFAPDDSAAGRYVLQAVAEDGSRSAEFIVEPGAAPVAANLAIGR